MTLNLLEETEKVTTEIKELRYANLLYGPALYDITLSLRSIFNEWHNGNGESTEARYIFVTVTKTGKLR